MDDIRLRLYEAFLRYPAGQEVHTAASGRVLALHEVFLEIEDRAARISGIGEVRANIAFITGTPEQDVVPGALAMLKRLRLSRSSDDLAATFEELRGGFPKICQALVENALVDLRARLRGLPIAEHLGRPSRKEVPCNQCVFWGSDTDMRKNLARYLSLGFRTIKLRVGIGSIEDDERRLTWIRRQCGPQIDLAVDANGAWDADTALRNIERLAPFGICYVEQPTRAGDWGALERVARSSNTEVMIDEGLQTDEDVDRVCANRGRIAAHLKIAKAGGVAALLDIGRRFDHRQVRYVVGQMNEGGLATAVAVHAAMVLSPRIGELYGALDIENDPSTGVVYRSGTVSVPHGPGTGVTVRRDMMTLLWDSDSP